ncbi:MAG: hypothetical protein QOG38_701 [Hyphomicrobiales bacterium]|nr:hypothetical protein [Hyphomicrobiales bacterium]
MRLIAVAVAGLVTAGAASAQPMWGPDQGRFYAPERAPLWGRDRTWMGPIRPQQVAYIVESMGLDPVGPPMQTGYLVVQRAADEFGRIVRVTINTNNGRVVSVAPAGAPPAADGGPYAGYRQYGPGPYARPAPEADDDDEFAPPGAVRAPRAALPPGAMPPPGVVPPPRSAATTPYPANPYPPTPPQSEAHKPAAKSAIVTPTHPPQPRKRPEGAETSRKAEPGSVAPVQATPAPPAQGAKPSAPSTAMPPPAPLE